MRFFLIALFTLLLSLPAAAQSGDARERFERARLYLTDEAAYPALTKEQLDLISLTALDSGIAGMKVMLGEVLHEGKRAPKDVKKAAFWFESAGDAGGPYAWEKLYRIYAGKEEGIPRDMQKQALWLGKIVEKDIGAHYYYDYAFLLHEMDPVKHKDDIIKWAEKAKAADSNRRADGLLLKMKGGNEALAGIREEVKKEEALGIQPGFDTQVLQSLDFAEDEKDAAGGDAAARFRLGYAYLKGEGAPRDRDKGIALIREAAEAGQPHAQHQMGVMHQAGVSLPADEALALDFYKKAAAQGFAPSQFRLALLYAKGGKGVQPDPAASEEWLEKARAQEYGEALEHGAEAREGAAAFDQDCRHLQKPSVRVELDVAPVTFDHGKTQAELKAFGRLVLGPGAAGLHVPDFGYKLRNLSFRTAWQPARKEFCTGVSDLAFRISYTSKIYIIREYAEGTCEYDNVKQHELRHRKVDEELLNEYMPVLEKHLSELLHGLPPMGAASEALLTARKRELGRKISEKASASLKEMHDEIARRQIYIDTPEEYGRDRKDCGGAGKP